MCTLLTLAIFTTKSMDTITISDSTDRSFPFSRAMFEDPHVVYHGTWSAYSGRIESAGFGGFALPFDHGDVEAIMHAWEQVGILGGYAKDVFFARTPGSPRNELSMAGNFWHARAYATDGGGEVVRMMLKEAKEFEALGSEDMKRLALKSHWQQGLKNSPGHPATLRAVEFLEDNEALRAACKRVTNARKGIENIVRGGFPVVYALSVEPQWFGEAWETYLVNWKDGHRARVELRCLRDLISVDRIVAKAMYPNGTDPDFLPDWIRTWTDAEFLS